MSRLDEVTEAKKVDDERKACSDHADASSGSTTGPSTPTDGVKKASFVPHGAVLKNDEAVEEASTTTNATTTVEEVLQRCPDEKLISAEILVQLLRIQSKYLNDHPCLCTSRFRHTLHLLDHQHHKMLAAVCGDLQKLTIKNQPEDTLATLPYHSFVERIFEHEALRHSPAILDHEELKSEDKLEQRLGSILARLVSDYRAIFAIEEKAYLPDSSDDGVRFDHEHRKRHEEEDECPEEIKLMKVACEELTLECHKDSPESPRKDFVAAKDSRSSQERGDNKSPPPPSGETCQRCHPRKRKERNSESSEENERKFSRASSEIWESPCCSAQKVIQRCHSSTEVPDKLLDGDHLASVAKHCSAEHQDKLPEENNFYISEGPEELPTASNDTNGFNNSRAGWIESSAKDHHSEKLGEEEVQEKAEGASHEHHHRHHHHHKHHHHRHGEGDSPEDRLVIHPARRSSRKEKRSDSLPENKESAEKLQLNLECQNAYNNNNVEKESPPETTRKALTVSVSAPCTPENNVSGNSNNTPVKSWDLHSNRRLLDEHPPVSWMPPSVTMPDSSGDEELRHSPHSLSLINSHRYLDPSHHVSSQRRTSDPDAMRKAKLKMLKRQLSNVRKKMEEMEQKFQKSQGYKPSQADKQGHSDMRELLSEQAGLKRQIKTFRDGCAIDVLDIDVTSKEVVPTSVRRFSLGEYCSSTSSVSSEDSNSSLENDGSSLKEVVNESDEHKDGTNEESKSNNDNNNFSGGRRDLKAMRNSLEDLEADLRAKRALKGRTSVLDDMTAEQLVSEKSDLHAAIMRFEATLGAPETPEEKELMKGVYDRYRAVKRLVRRSSASRTKEQQLELETIPEDEAITLTLASPQHRINLETEQQQQSSCKKRAKACECEGFVGMRTANPATLEIEETAVRQKLKGNDDNEEEQKSLEGEEEEANLHSMSRYELLQVYRRTREEKRQHRRAIKEIEESFQRETGRRLLKEDRSEAVYGLYKNAKARLKLIDALLSKKVDHFF